MKTIEETLTDNLAHQVRDDFDFFKQNPGVAYLDSGASSLTPRVVSDAVAYYYNHLGVNIHRGVYRASQEATEVYESAREKVKEFLGAGDNSHVVYTRNATEGFNLLAYSLEQVTGEFSDMAGLSSWQGPWQPGDVIIISESEHHANIVPWQMLAQRKNLRLELIKVDQNSGELSQSHFEQLRQDLKNERVRIVSLAGVSNASGIVHDLSGYQAYAREKGALFIVDGAQQVCHQAMNLEKADYDFFLFSAHKMLGPSGLGILWGRGDLLDVMPPFMGGGDMILNVGHTSSSYQVAPHRFEAGTPHIAGVFGLVAAIEYIEKVGFDRIQTWEDYLTLYALEKIEALGLQVYGPTLADIDRGLKRIGAISFNLEDVHPHDIGTILDQNKVAIRVGHHCCQLLMKAWQVPATNRASLYLYNSPEDIDQLVHALQEVKKIFV